MRVFRAVAEKSMGVCQKDLCPTPKNMIEMPPTRTSLDQDVGQRLCPTLSRAVSRDTAMILCPTSVPLCVPPKTSPDLLFYFPNFLLGQRDTETTPPMRSGCDTNAVVEQRLTRTRRTLRQKHAGIAKTVSRCPAATSSQVRALIGGTQSGTRPAGLCPTTPKETPA